MENKACQSCKTEKPLSDFYHNVSPCKTCYDKWRVAHPSPCNRCRVVKPYSKFIKGKMMCRDCNAEQCRARYGRNAEQRRAEGVRYYRENRKRILARIAAAPSTRNRQYEKEYRQKNARKYREYQNLRRSRIKATEVEPFTVEDVLVRDGSVCYLCEKVLGRDEVSLEHVAPLSRGGSHTLNNVRIACLPCNRRKGARLLHELDLSAFHAT